MTTWQNVSDEVFLQAHINHVIRVWGHCPDIPEDKVSLVIERAKRHYEMFPDQVEALEKEIAKLIMETK